MKRHPFQPAWPIALAALAAVLSVSGCAGLRIDQTGDHILTWDARDPAVGTPAAPATVVVQPTIDPNQTAAPVYSTGSDSGCCIRPIRRLLHGPEANTPQPGQPITEPPSDRVTLSPGRVLAPVGTEVVLRAGVCGKEGYFLTNRKIEWMLGQEGAGQFAMIGEQGKMDIGRLPWSRPKKVDNHFAVGYTAPFYTCLRRGTNTPADDVQVKKGEAWITVTSASEGTSYVTAYAPTVENWNTRRARATIYWIDAQWQMPPSAVVAAGQQHRLTTTVTRQSDGAPLAGWIVRYEVADSSAAQLGYAAGQAAEETTDGSGHASVDVTPTDSKPGTTRIRITVVRPEQAGVASSPRLNVGTGEATITWSNTAPGTQPLLPPVAPPSTPTFPPTTPPITPTEPPIGVQPPTGQPRLQLSVQPITQAPVKVGEQMTYRLVFQNTGDAVAKNLNLTVRFDSGLTHPGDTLGKNEIFLKNIGDLSPTDLPLEKSLAFVVKTPGTHWCEMTLSSDGLTPEFDRQSFEAIEDRPPAANITLQTSITLIRQEAGKVVGFRATITNAGTTAAEGLQFFLYADRSLTISRGPSSSEATTDGGFVFNLGRLEPGMQRVLPYELTCQHATQIGRPAEIRAFVRGEGVNVPDRKEVEVDPQLTQPQAGGSSLSVSIASNVNPAKLRSRPILYVTLQNTSQQLLRGVQVRFSISPQLTPLLSVAQVPQGAGGLRQNGAMLELSSAIPEIPPGGEAKIILPCEAVQQGAVGVEVHTAWQGAAVGTSAAATLTIEP